MGDEGRKAASVCINPIFSPRRVTQAPPVPPALLAKMVPRVLVATPVPRAVPVTPVSKALLAPPARKANPARMAPRYVFWGRTLFHAHLVLCCHPTGSDPLPLPPRRVLTVPPVPKVWQDNVASSVFLASVVREASPGCRGHR